MPGTRSPWQHPEAGGGARCTPGGAVPAGGGSAGDAGSASGSGGGARVSARERRGGGRARQPEPEPGPRTGKENRKQPRKGSGAVTGAPRPPGLRHGAHLLHFQRGPGAPVRVAGVQPRVRAAADREIHRGERHRPREQPAPVRGAAHRHQSRAPDPPQTPLGHQHPGHPESPAGRVGCRDAAQLHAAAAAADHTPGAVPRPVPARCRLQGHRPPHQGGHCRQRSSGHAEASGRAHRAPGGAIGAAQRGCESLLPIPALVLLLPNPFPTRCAPIPSPHSLSLHTSQGAGEAMDLGELAGMTPEIIQKLQDKATVLTTERKKRGKTVPEELVKPEELSKYRQVASHVGLHSASIPGILALDLCPSDTNKILTGGADKNVIVFDKSSEQILATLKGHTKKVTSVVFHPSQDLVFSASPDATIRIWSVPNASCVQVVRAHEGSVTGLSLHATGDYLLSSSDDQYWAFSDIQTGRVLTKVTDESSGCALTCAQFHPDGLIFGTGTMDSQIKIWDLKERTNVANFPGHSGPITSIAFSENGYYLATAADDSSVKLWDLRKLKNFKTLQLDNNFEVKSLIFDQSGTYLALGGTDVQIYICKQWTEILHFTEHSGLTTGVAFGHHAKFIASTGMDRSLKFYSL